MPGSQRDPSPRATTGSRAAHGWNESELAALCQLVAQTGANEWDKKAAGWKRRTGVPRSAKALMGKYYKYTTAVAASKSPPASSSSCSGGGAAAGAGGQKGRGRPCSARRPDSVRQAEQMAQLKTPAEHGRGAQPPPSLPPPGTRVSVQLRCAPFLRDTSSSLSHLRLADWIPTTECNGCMCAAAAAAAVAAAAGRGMWALSFASP
jgi:hypothetical protein